MLYRCSSENPCKDQEINCPTGDAGIDCSLTCGSKSSCQDSEITISGSEIFTLNCDAEDSCKTSIINCCAQYK